MKEWLRSIPPVHEFQKDSRFLTYTSNNQLDNIIATEKLKQTLTEVRELILENCWDGSLPGTEEFLIDIFTLLESKTSNEHTYTLKPVINATGTILHTNLGRARLSNNAMKHVIETAQSYSNLEYEIAEGKRGSRHSHIEAILKQLTGAESAMVVNNNAAAVYLILNALAKEKEVIVSRGQLVEIGGSFRISSIMEESGAKMVEVGTTNKTHLYDYENAISPETAMIMKVHTSNFKTIGFTKTVETEEIASLANQHGLIFYEDLGSGALYDFRKHGIGDEPVVKEILDAGADIISFSGDKLLGGPQAGIIAGKKKWIDRLKKHQLARVLRVDKMTLAALEGTLLDYLKGEKGLRQIPTLRDLLTDKNEMKERTEYFIQRLRDINPLIDARIDVSYSQVGGGTMPEVELETFIAALKHKGLTAEQMAMKLRKGQKTSIVGRIQKDELLLDLRTVTDEEEIIILEALQDLS
ncbi:MULTISPECIES: L-seryl-tRNA(Sec) selenium transferase [unclassified Bacillus (in: firmicutes)]|uniref:L-seryl-tRNA(Sec) selenium transferase n=1 Tax=unclassified Bacillus (in: firmicutes) TaxID=185979 RepID=UPI0008E9584D|nr:MULTISPECIES: L-seryl-tRNA(Sec) selenium transferase [unclassified Bacillus (in: firmicutes)]SFA88898.1 L-seryl-tRNA(Sec) selenium transferase [Bacillus sp. UNCCL13]SFQ84738.1 L-seryl-tRNA(Sec) selenium transferase [Bacillus sp. cl95]